MYGLITAIGILTRLPLPRRFKFDPAASLYWFPLVGWIIAAIHYRFIDICLIFIPGWIEGIAIISVLFNFLITGGIHMDGLADFTDAFFISHTREDILKIMKDPHKGTFGASAIFFDIFIKYLSIRRLIEHNEMLWSIFPAFVFSRTSMVYLASLLPYARQEGGLGKEFIENGSLKHILFSTFLALSILSVFRTFSLYLIYFYLIALMVPLLMAIGLAKKIGGVTGDTLGACNEFVEIGIFIFSAFIID